MTQISRSDNTVVATFEYDALGRRIEKKDMLTGTAKRYYYDDQRIVLQTTIPSGGSQSDEKYFVYGNYIDEVLLMHNLAGTYTGDFYYGHDHLYSPVALFESDGDLVERYEYDVYGACRTLDSGYSLLSSSAYGNPYTFTGRELDSFDNNTFKLMYYRARSYDPQTGRFLQRDPLQYVDGMNLYEYVKSMPINYSDSFGLKCTADVIIRRCYVEDKDFHTNLPFGLGLNALSQAMSLIISDGAIGLTNQIAGLLRNALPSLKYIKDVNFHPTWTERCVVTKVPCKCGRYDYPNTKRKVCSIQMEGDPVAGGLWVPEIGPLFTELKNIASELRSRYPDNCTCGDCNIDE